MKITELEKTCPSHPAQWEGRLDDGRFIYIRYRWGVLRVGVGNDLDAAVRNVLYIDNLGHEYDGELSEEQLKAATGSILQFP